MKRTKLLCAAIFCCTLANAQDTYWPLADNMIYNTATQTVFTSSQDMVSSGGGFSFDGDAQVVFNADAEVLFTGGPNSPNFHLSGVGQQVVPIPNACGEYVGIKLAPQITPHGHVLSVQKIDVSAVTNNIGTTGLPSIASSSNLWAGIDPAEYGAVAAKLNLDGTRYFYHLNKNASGGYATLYRYTLDEDGDVVNPSTPVTISTGLPAGVQLHMSQDGQSIGYFMTDDDGHFVTYTIGGSYTIHDTYDPLTSSATFSIDAFAYSGGAEQVTINSHRYWFIGSNDQVGYVEEGNSDFYDVQDGGEPYRGLNTSFALGRDGLVYYAYDNDNPGSDPAGSDGDLCYFTPDVLVGGGTIKDHSHFVDEGNAYIRATNWNGTSYLFGNHVTGEDINSVSEPLYAPTFNINNLTGGSTASAPTDILLCTNQTITLTLNTWFSNIPDGYRITLQTGGLLMGGGFGVANTYTDDISTYSTVNAHSLVSSFPWLTSYSGLIRVSIEAKSPCGMGSPSPWQIFNLKQAGAQVDFFLVGPSSFGTPACPSPNGLPSHNGLQPRVTNTATVTANRPAGQPLASPVCSLGWVGAFTCGVHQGYVNPQNVSLTGYTLTVDEYNSSGGGTPTNIITNYATSMPAQGYQFNQLCSLYFYNNYATIRDNNFYKVTLEVSTPECGPYSNYAWFKILNGGTAGSFWREGDPNAITEDPFMEKIYMYPNPATDQVHVAWNSNAKEDGLAQISVTDVMGRVVLQKDLPQSFGTNDVPLDISQLTAGVYHYVLKTSNETTKGSLVKQ